MSKMKIEMYWANGHTLRSDLDIASISKMKIEMYWANEHTLRADLDDAIASIHRVTNRDVNLNWTSKFLQQIRLSISSENEDRNVFEETQEDSIANALADGRICDVITHDGETLAFRGCKFENTD